MGKLKALLFTEGMHGMISQAEGMARALKTDFHHKCLQIFRSAGDTARHL